MGILGGLQTAVAEGVSKSGFVGNDSMSENDNMHMNMNNMNNMNNSGARSPLVMIVALVLWVILFLLVSKWLWNNVLTKLVTVVKPADSVWQLLGLAVLLSLMGGN